MDLTSWAFYAFIAAAAIVAAFFHYRLREPTGRGRAALAALRGVVLAILVLLLFDPLLPAAPIGGDRGPVVLLDRSLSMGMASDAGGTRWEEALDVVTDLAPTRVLLVGGDEAAAVEPGALGGLEPASMESRLAPALQAAAEAGAGAVVVVTDSEIEDPEAAAGLARSAGLRLDVRRVGGDGPANLALAEVEAPQWLEVGEEAAVRVAVASRGVAGGDSIGVTLEREGRELARARVVVPPPGRLGGAMLRFTPRTPAAEPVRLDVRLLSDDAEPDDDRRSIYVRISADPAGVALVSFRPDQEPRFLLPVLERALGVAVRGWMALPGGRYIRLGVGEEAGAPADESTLRGALAEADLVVLHGLTPDAPEWALRAAAETPRLLVFPAAAAIEPLPFPPGPARPGDWYPATDIPSSPVAAVMAGAEPGDAPPLTELRTPQPPPDFWAPLAARAGRRGAASPVLVAGTVGQRRVAMALADGYWRWAFAGGAPRELYDRLWSAVGGWLVQDLAAAAADAVEPTARVVARGEAPRFAVPAGTDSVRIQVRAVTVDAQEQAGQAAAVDTVVAPEGTSVGIQVLDPGHYRYSARAYGTELAAASEAEASGALTVESYSPEFTRRAAVVDAGVGEDGAAMQGASRRSAAARGATRPLRSMAWPYVALVLVLCTEWILRRRWGLR